MEDDLCIYQSNTLKYGVINDNIDEIIPPISIKYLLPSNTKDYVITEHSGQNLVFNREGERV